MLTEQNIITFAKEILFLSKYLKKISRNKEFIVSIKNDGSKVTDADIYSDIEIKKMIKNIFNNTSVLSEEDTFENQKQIIEGGDYFIVDPIDGTDSFILGDDFCVNVAYCQNNIPIFGAIALPLQDIVYFTMNSKIYGMESDYEIYEIKNPILNKDKIVLSVGKKMFFCGKSDKLDAFISKNGYTVDGAITKNAGIKYLSTILGISDATINFGPAKDWDLANIFVMANIFGFKMVDKNDNPIKFGDNDLSHLNGIFLYKKT